MPQLNELLIEDTPFRAPSLTFMSAPSDALAARQARALLTDEQHPSVEGRLDGGIVAMAARAGREGQVGTRSAGVAFGGL